MRSIILFNLMFLLLFSNAIYSQQLSFSDLILYKKAGDDASEIVKYEYVKSLMQKDYEEERFYGALYDMFANYLPIVKSDNIDEDLRAEINEKLKIYYPYLMNAAAYYYEKTDYTKATAGFEMLDFYIHSDDFAGTDDPQIYIMAPYYAAVSAYLSDDNDKAIYLLNELLKQPYVENEYYKQHEIYELLADKYKQRGDLSDYLQTLQQGINACPEHIFHFTSLKINYYIEQNDLQQAHIEIDNLLKNKRLTQENRAAVFNLKGQIYLHEKEYGKAEKIFQQSVKQYPQKDEGYDGIATVYVLQAQELKDAASLESDAKKQKKLNEESTKLYKKALSYAQKMKIIAENNASKDMRQRAIHLLRNIYFNLGMERELDLLGE